MHLFDVVNQYRAIFSDDTSGSEENCDGGLLFSWAMHQITSNLKTLKVMLPKITEGISLSNILDQCMVSFFPFTYMSTFDGEYKSKCCYDVRFRLRILYVFCVLCQEYGTVAFL